MSDVGAFRLYAEEAMRDSSKAVSEAEKRALEELACTWMKAAAPDIDHITCVACTDAKGHKRIAAN